MSAARWSVQFAWGRAPYALDLPEITIGRGDTCPLQIDEPASADEHARFIVDEDDQVWLEDLGSGSETLVNGRAIKTRTRLTDGDFVQIGHSVLTVRQAALAPADAVHTAPPDAHTMEATQLPAQVQRALAERDARNIVVGTEQPTQLRTVMMESPMPQGTEPPRVRDQQRTIEVDASAILASIRGETVLPASDLPVPGPVSSPDAMPTQMMAAVAPPDEPAPSDNGAPTQMMAAVVPPDESAPPSAPPVRRATGSRPTMLGVGPNDMAAAPTMLKSVSTPSLSVPTDTPVPETNEIPAATTMIAEAPRMAEPAPTPAPRRSRSTMADITPLPAPLPPPTSSIPDLGPFVEAASAAHGEFDASEPTRAQKKSATTPPITGEGFAPLPGYAVGTEPTQLPQELPPEVLALHAQKTVAPTEAPRLDTLHNAKTMAPMEAPKVESLHDQKTRAPTELPPEVLAAQARQRAQTEPPAKTVPPTSKVEPLTPPPGTQAPVDYIPPKKGLFGSFSRALDFFEQMFALAKREPALKRPIFRNLAIATPVSLALSALLLFVHSPGAVYGILSLGVALLYFIDYASNALTASLMYDYVTTGKVDLPAAKARVKKSFMGIVAFAAVSALLDVATTYARERRDVVSRVLLRILHAIWTTATYVIMPAMVIEGISFKEAFARSKKLMDQDPTGVGAGVVALSLVTYICAAIIFPLAYFLLNLGSRIHPVLGMALFFMMVNAFWAISGWLKIAYSTCFYMWAQKCEAAGRADPSLAPVPLRHAMDAG